MTYLEPWYVQTLKNIENPLKRLRCIVCFNESWHIYDEVFYSELSVTITYLDFWYIQNLIIFITQDIRYRQSLRYSLHRTLCNLEIFIIYIYSVPGIFRTPGIWRAVFYATLCNTGIIRTRGKFRTLPNIYYEETNLEPYLET